MNELFTRCLSLALLVALAAAGAEGGQGDDSPVAVALIKMPYSGARNVPEISPVPDYLEQGGIGERLERAGAVVEAVSEIRLTADQEKEYGAWHRMGLANGHLGTRVVEEIRGGRLPVGLLANCTSLLGVLAGLQDVEPEPRRVGLVFIDAHGDINTPETTESGYLDGMGLAILLGWCFARLAATVPGFRPLPEEHAILLGVRDLDVLEAERVAASGVRTLSPGEAVSVLEQRLEELAGGLRGIYVHLDPDVLDPSEGIPNNLPVPDGLTVEQLERALAQIRARIPLAGLGVGSYDPSCDRDGRIGEAIVRVVGGALSGFKAEVERSQRADHRGV